MFQQILQLFFSKKNDLKYLGNKIYWVLMLIICTSQLSAQSGDNPFELQHRLEKKEKTQQAEILKNDPGVSNHEPTVSRSDNPFDITRPSAQNSTTKMEEPPPAIKVESTEMPDDSNFRFWMIIVMLILLAVATSMYRNQIMRSFRAFSNENVMRMLHRDKGTIAYLPYYVLYLLFIINAGIYVYLLAHYLKVNIAESHLKTLGYTIAVVAFIFFLKHTALRFIGAIFPVNKEASLYNMTITIFGIVLGTLIVLANLFIAYGPSSLQKVFVVGSFILIGGVYFFRSIRGLSIGSKFLGFHKFHFFIYLCTLEIAPVLILWKLILLKTGIH